MTPRPAVGSWTTPAILLALSGAGLVLVGACFLLLRPPLLPEDIRYMGLSDDQLAERLNVVDTFRETLI